MCACVRARACVCVRTCVRVCVRACVRAHVCNLYASLLALCISDAKRLMIDLRLFGRK